MFFPLNILLLVLDIVAYLSQHIDIEDAGLIYKEIFATRFLSHSIS